METPDAALFKRWLREAMEVIPRGQGYRFEPSPLELGSDKNPRDPHYDGVSQDVWVGHERVARSAPDGATYCCGVTFEVFARAWALGCQEQGASEGLGSLTGAQLHEFITTWYCPTMGHLGVVEALVGSGLGFRVDPEQAQSGDFCQFWRSTEMPGASGHSVVFLGWEGPKKTSVRYWSSQAATDGVGVYQEPIGEGWTWGFARVGVLEP